MLFIGLAVGFILGALAMYFFIRKMAEIGAQVESAIEGGSQAARVE
jgi:hypothetical protein